MKLLTILAALMLANISIAQEYVPSPEVLKSRERFADDRIRHIHPLGDIQHVRAGGMVSQLWTAG